MAEKEETLSKLEKMLDHYLGKIEEEGKRKDKEPDNPEPDKAVNVPVPPPAEEKPKEEKKTSIIDWLFG